jgi:hypothetical protein
MARFQLSIPLIPCIYMVQVLSQELVAFYSILVSQTL